jgi:DNA (cytosine-5)-methyltransferase 1
MGVDFGDLFDHAARAEQGRCPTARTPAPIVQDLSETPALAPVSRAIPASTSAKTDIEVVADATPKRLLDLPLPTFHEYFADGGMARLGLDGWRCVFANDFDVIKGRAYIANFGAEHFNATDVAKFTVADLPPGRPNLVWASPPCTDVSIAGERAGLAVGTRSGVFWPWWHLMQQVRPEILVIENVTGLLSSHGGADIAAIREELSAAGYHHRTFKIDAAHFRPQSRERVFIVAAHRPIPDLPPMPHRNTTLADLVDFNAPCDTADKTIRLIDLMSPKHREELERAKSTGSRLVLAGYRRTRDQQRFEVRADGLAGCLRTAAGGSSIQDLVIVDGAIVRSRKLLPREGARLMGLPDSYRLPANSKDANNLIGDGVCVPVVAFLSEHVLEPLMPKAAASDFGNKAN